MELYTQTTNLPSVVWAEPMETAWQRLTTGPSVPGSKMPHLSIADQLFVAAAANTPRPVRPWGVITWLSGMFQISRPIIYDLCKRSAKDLERSVSGRPTKTQAIATPMGAPSRDHTITATPNRTTRTALTMAFPGNMALRPMQARLETAFDRTRGLGTLSEMLTQAGQRAGQILEEIDHGPLGPVIVLRDKIYFQD